jgi:hypothetical protein
MKNPHLSLDEFKSLFTGQFESEEQLLEQYESFLEVVRQVDQAPVPELSASQKAAIFRQAWQRPAVDPSWIWAPFALLRQPAVTFAAGLVFGCTLMLVFVKGQAVASPPPAVEEQPSLTVQRARYTETYEGKVLQELYPQIENPRIVIEKSPESSEPKRAVYGTLDDGEVYVVMNL